MFYVKIAVVSHHEPRYYWFSGPEKITQQQLNRLYQNAKLHVKNIMLLEAGHLREKWSKIDFQILMHEIAYLLERFRYHALTLSSVVAQAPIPSIKTLINAD